MYKFDRKLTRTIFSIFFVFVQITFETSDADQNEL